MRTNKQIVPARLSSGGSSICCILTRFVRLPLRKPQIQITAAPCEVAIETTATRIPLKGTRGTCSRRAGEISRFDTLRR